VRFQPAPVQSALRARYATADFTHLGTLTRPDILIAGCGTGLQITLAVAGLAAWDLTALDLSKASLAYAQRQIADLQIPDVRFLQGDILDLGDVNTTFDVIECIGVLHHMADPLQGWRTIADRLRPGGVMLVGLYSGRARTGIELAQRYVAAHGYAATPADVRRFRHDILTALLHSAPSLELAAVAQSGITAYQDFYSVSMCRDLLFHVQERQMRIDDIAQMTAALELRFLGFVFPSDGPLSLYRAMYPGDPNGLNLANWKEFEDKYPDTFINMYAFQVQKPIT